MSTGPTASPKKGSLNHILCSTSPTLDFSPQSNAAVVNTPDFAPPPGPSDADDGSQFDQPNEQAGSSDLDNDTGDVWSEPKRKRQKVAEVGKDGVVKTPRRRGPGLNKGIKAAAKEPKVTSRKSGRLGRLATALTGLPIEMLSEILSHSTPATLLRLSRTAKIFRALLFTKSSRPIWIRAFLNDGFPEPFTATDFNEPSVARLIWDKECWVRTRKKGPESSIADADCIFVCRFVDEPSEPAPVDLGTAGVSADIHLLSPAVCLRRLLPKPELMIALADECLHPDVWSCVPCITRPPWSYAQVHGEFYMSWAIKAANDKLKKLAMEDARDNAPLSSDPSSFSTSLAPYTSLPNYPTGGQQALISRLFPPHLAQNTDAAIAHLESILFPPNSLDENGTLLIIYNLAKERMLSTEQFTLLGAVAASRLSTIAAQTSSAVPAASTATPSSVPISAIPLPPPSPSGTHAALQLFSTHPTKDSRVAHFIQAYKDNLPKIEKVRTILFSGPSVSEADHLREQDTKMCEEWQKTLDKSRADLRTTAFRDRLDGIVAHLTKAGFSDEDIVLGVTPGTSIYPIIDQPYPLTDRVWRKIGPVIKSFIESQVATRQAEAVQRAQTEAALLARQAAGIPEIPSVIASSEQPWRWKPPGWENGWDPLRGVTVTSVPPQRALPLPLQQPGMSQPNSSMQNYPAHIAHAPQHPHVGFGTGQAVGLPGGRMPVANLGALNADAARRLQDILVRRLSF
ncbi:hypothetical protein P7C70_g2216, partial [Phenoliferia sp. Uapishka_3]